MSASPATPTADEMRELGALFDTRRFADMERLATLLVDRHPTSGQAWKALGTARHMQGKPAVRALQHAVQWLPHDAQAFNTLAAALLDAGQADAAESASRRALALQPRMAEAHTNLARALHLQNRHASACDAYTVALGHNPHLSPALIGLGAVQMERGHLLQARAAFEAAIAQAPDQIEALYGLTQLSTFRTSESGSVPDLLERLVTRTDAMPMEMRLRFWFALGKAREDLGRFEEAFAAYREGNRLKSASLPAQDDNVLAGLTARIMAGFSREAMRAQLSAQPGAGCTDDTPVFIVGMPRSGTTLLEQILASHRDIHGAGELHDLNDILLQTQHGPVPLLPERAGDVAIRPQLAQVGDAYLQRLRRHAPEAARIIDKMPANFFHLGWIHMAIPGARIIHVTRNPMDTCFSCYARLFADDKQAFSYDLATLGRYHRHYTALMAHWRTVLPPGAMLEVCYEDVVNDIEGQTRRMLDYLDMPWDERCLDFHKNKRPVKTASAAQVHQPIYRGSLDRWQNFSAQLAPLKKIIDA